MPGFSPGAASARGFLQRLWQNDTWARALDPKGRVFTEDAMGDVLASRELSAFLRDMGETGGGPRPYTPQDRSRFLNALENQIQALHKRERQML